MVSIAAFQAVDPGSIPGRRSVFTAFSYLTVLNFIHSSIFFHLFIVEMNYFRYFFSFIADLSQNLVS